MSRRNNDAITIHSILSWIEDNLESPLSLEKVSERSGYSKWHLQRMFKKETGHSLGQYIRSRKLTEIAQKSSSRVMSQSCTWRNAMVSSRSRP